MDQLTEGIVSKRSNAPYRPGRNDAWLKSKCIKEQELVIGGYTEQPKHPGVLGALLIGTFEGERLRVAGKVGTGFTQAEGHNLLTKLKARPADNSPFLSLDTASRRRARFVRPELVAQVNFSEWTPDGRLRHPSFQGLREDKPAEQVVREKEKPLAAVAKATSAPAVKKSKAASGNDASAAHVRITHPDRVLWPDAGITKLELARYYAALARFGLSFSSKYRLAGRIISSGNFASATCRSTRCFGRSNYFQLMLCRDYHRDANSWPRKSSSNTYTRAKQCGRIRAGGKGG